MQGWNFARGTITDDAWLMSEPAGKISLDDRSAHWLIAEIGKDIRAIIFPLPVGMSNDLAGDFIDQCLVSFSNSGHHVMDAAFLDRVFGLNLRLTSFPISH